MPNRYYRISPLRFGYRPERRSAPSWHLHGCGLVPDDQRDPARIVTGVSCAPVFTPTTLQTFKESRDITSTTAVERPRLALSPHSDGLGWTVRVTQLVGETNRIRREGVYSCSFWVMDSRLCGTHHQERSGRSGDGHSRVCGYSEGGTNQI
jgi:hypothetical protein